MKRAAPLACAPEPCGSCPYRRDTPPGVWAPEEYQKLTEYADQPDGVPALGIFLCHQTNATGRETVCRGWLAVERESVAVRLGLATGSLTVAQVDAAPAAPLYATGVEAAAAGRAGVAAPSPAAERVVERLLKKGAGRLPRPRGRRER